MRWTSRHWLRRPLAALIAVWFRRVIEALGRHGGMALADARAFVGGLRWTP